ncbi:hypothetical protein BC567DRAFT_212992 [Phyllosticta citribraziliensis]
MYGDLFGTTANGCHHRSPLKPLASIQMNCLIPGTKDCLATTKALCKRVYQRAIQQPSGHHASSLPSSISHHAARTALVFIKAFFLTDSSKPRATMTPLQLSKTLSLKKRLGRKRPELRPAALSRVVKRRLKSNNRNAVADTVSVNEWPSGSSSFVAISTPNGCLSPDQGTLGREIVMLTKLGPCAACS